MEENRFSRQILSLGRRGHNNLKNGIVSIYNLGGGLGTEICKNLILQGVGILILNDINKSIFYF